jgi:hypothetical protein
MLYAFDDLQSKSVTQATVWFPFICVFFAEGIMERSCLYPLPQKRLRFDEYDIGGLY